MKISNVWVSLKQYQIAFKTSRLPKIYAGAFLSSLGKWRIEKYQNFPGSQPHVVIESSAACLTSFFSSEDMWYTHIEFESSIPEK